MPGGGKQSTNRYGDDARVLDTSVVGVDVKRSSKPGWDAGRTTARKQPGLAWPSDQSASALQEQSAACGASRAERASALPLHSQSSARGTNFASLASALPLHSQSSALGANPGLSTPKAIPAAATNLSNMIICDLAREYSAAWPTPDKALQTLNPCASSTYLKTARERNGGKYLPRGKGKCKMKNANCKMENEEGTPNAQWHAKSKMGLAVWLKQGLHLAVDVLVFVPVRKRA